MVRTTVVFSVLLIWIDSNNSLHRHKPRNLTPRGTVHGCVVQRELVDGRPKLQLVPVAVALVAMVCAFARFTENVRLPGDVEPWTGRGPCRWSPARPVAWNRSWRSTHANLLAERVEIDAGHAALRVLPQAWWNREEAPVVGRSSSAPRSSHYLDPHEIIVVTFRTQAPNDAAGCCSSGCSRESPFVQQVFISSSVFSVPKHDSEGVVVAVVGTAHVLRHAGAANILRYSLPGVLSPRSVW